MKNYPNRDFEIFIVSGDSVNCAATVRSIIEVGGRTAPISVYAEWPLQEFPEDLRSLITWRPQLPRKAGELFAITKENNRALRDIWGRGLDAILIEDDVVLKTPRLLDQLAEFAAALDGRCLLSPGIEGFKYDNVVCTPRQDMQLHREPVHFPIICCYFPVELELLVGYYDEGYISYGCDDNDYSLRLVKAGIPMLCAPKLVAQHLYDERSVFKVRGRDQYVSREYFKRKWGQYPGDPKLR